MAQVKTLVGEKLLIQIETAPNSTIFAHPCMINAERGIEFSSETNEFVVPDCDNPSAPGWKELFKDGMSAQVSGGGMLHTTDLEAYFTWMNSDDAKNVRVKIDVPGANGGGYIAGAMKLTSLSISGPRKANTTVDITIQSHGPMTWTDNA